MKRTERGKPPALKFMEFIDSEVEEAIRGKQLLAIDIHMSNRCNFRCPGCYRDAGDALSSELNMNECKDILCQSKELGAKTWIVTGSGEPFLDAKLPPLIKFANSIGINVVVFTNNSCITRRTASWIFKQDVSVIAKLNSFEPSIQDFIVGVTGAHKKILRGLKNLISAGMNRESPSRLGIDSVIIKQNYAEIPKIFRFCRDNNIVPYITTELHGGRGVNNASKIDASTEKIKEIFFKLRDIDRSEYAFEWEPHPPVVAGGSCKKILYQIFVGPSGEIGVCPGLGIADLGNIRNVSLKDILKSDLINKIRHPEKFFQPCVLCSRKGIKKCTGGCLLSKHSAGNLWGEDPQCCW
jgi:MoaA/NifB/PqqE/SkfB family radical SAM enzyme